MPDPILPTTPAAVTPVITETTTQAQPPAQPASPDEGTLLGKKSAEETESAELETPEQKAEREATEAANVVPEKYEIKAPEGMNVDPKVLETLTPVFKELELSQADVQKLSDAYAPFIKANTEAAIESHRTQVMKDYESVVDGWKQDSIKTLGADYQKKLAPAAALMDKFPKGEELRAMLDKEQTGVGNHPIMVEFLIWLGSSIRSDSFPDQNKDTQGQGVNHAERLFPSTPKK